jgi:SAM-dependent methyltransferase
MDPASIPCRRCVPVRAGPFSTMLHFLHVRYIQTRRAEVLAKRFARLIPHGASVLDVGCGDGFLSSLITRERPDITLHGIDVLVRENARLDVQPFDGRNLPFPAGSFDVVLFADVLHHTAEPMVLLREAVRVASQAVLIKDHSRDGWLAGWTLRYMDLVGNARYGVALPYNYWTRRHWLRAFCALGVDIGVWQTDLRLYPRPLGWIFGRSLHFIARLDV